MKLLMHTCCAPCSVYCIDKLRKEEIEPTLYWFNPNIHPYQEYKARRDCLKQYSQDIKINAIFEEDYGLREFCKNTIGSLDTRCGDYCYPVRLEQTAKYAKENGFDTITTTLLVSPYQKHDIIHELGEKIAKNYGLEFLYRDFRVGFREGQAKAREIGLYMQKYCGCIFSEESSVLPHTDTKPNLPEGFEFLPAKRTIILNKEKNDKKQYMALLLEADPSEKMIEEYLKDGDVFVLRYKDEIAVVAVVIKVDNDTVELKNIVTKEKFRGKGYAKKMIKYLADNYKQRYKRMLVGTTENNIPFYVKQGFDKYEKTIKDFFIDNYDKEIWDGDLHCMDMYYYSKSLVVM